MSEICNSERKPLDLPNEADVLAENKSLRAEVTRLTTLNVSLATEVSELKAEKTSFAKAVAVKVASLGIGLTPTQPAAYTGNASTELAAHKAALRKRNEFFGRSE
jgi:hypothetical protein